MKKPSTQMRVVSLRRFDSPDERYGFSLGAHGFVINGFAYLRESGSIQMPSAVIGGRRIALVKAFGVHINRLRVQLEELLSGEETDDASDWRAGGTAAEQ